MGAASARHSLRPLPEEGHIQRHHSGITCREIANSHLLRIVKLFEN
jgi:hypothetical protein